jgi:hypothetical protein
MTRGTILALLLSATFSPALAGQTVDSTYFNLLEWRSVGPSRGGRVVAVAGDPRDPMTFYQGTTGGGVWKTEDGGINWNNVSDGFVQTGSVGAIAVSASETRAWCTSGGGGLGRHRQHRRALLGK